MNTDEAFYYYYKFLKKIVFKNLHIWSQNLTLTFNVNLLTTYDVCLLKHVIETYHKLIWSDLEIT